jgi:RNA polymerase sigma-70 factor (ECF subfamily)
VDKAEFDLPLWQSMHISDEQLVDFYLKGDKKSLETLVSRYLGLVYVFVFRLAGNSGDAEDIVQEAFLKTWKNLKKFDREKKFKTWLFNIAKNAAVDHLRKKKAFLFSDLENNEDKLEFSETIRDPSPLADEIFDRKRLNETLSLLIEKLTIKQRTVLYLYYNDHFNFREISEILDEPLDTVKSRHRRALIRLKEMLESENAGK